MHKELNLFTQAVLLLRRPPYWNKHGSTHSSRSTSSSRLARHVERVVSSRDVTSQVGLCGQVYAALYHAPWHVYVNQLR